MSKKVAVVGIAVALVLGLGGAAFAYFTAGGTGTGSATVGTATNWNIAQTSTTGGPLYPDATIGGANIETLSSVTVSVAYGNGSAWWVQSNTADPACTAADFSIGASSPGTPFVDTSVTGAFTPGQTATGSVTVEMIDNGLNQDNCQGVTVPLYFTTTPSAAAVNPNLSIEGADGSGGWQPNATFAIDPSVTVGDTDVALTVTAIQPNTVNADGTFTLTYDNTFLTFTGEGDTSGTCTTPTASGDVSTVSCSYTDISHSDTSKPFSFTPLKPGETSVTAVVEITGSGTATQTFPLSITS
jgi:hypothetical protein